MGVWIHIENEEHFFLLRSTLERSMDKRAGLLPDNVREMYEGVLVSMKTATKDVPDRPMQVEVGLANPKPKKQKPRAPSGSVTKIVHCQDHPTYGAQRRPRTECPRCWAAYERLHGPNPTAKAAVARKKQK